MSKTTKEKILKRVSFRKTKIFLVLTLIAFFSLLPIIFSLAQEKEFVIEFLHAKEPVNVVSFKVDDKTVVSNEKFSYSQDFLKVFSANLKNPSEKTVTYVDVGIFVVRPKGQEDIPLFHYNITRGNKNKALNKIESGLEFKPSKSSETFINIALPDEEYAQIRASLDKLGYPPKIEHIKVQVEEVVFSDGTMWSIGSWYKLDPDDPDKIILISLKGLWGNENEIVTPNSLTGQCYSVFFAQRECSRQGNTICSARTAGAVDQSSPDYRVVRGYERCFIELPNGERGDYCGSDILVNLATVCPIPSPTPTPPPPITDECGEVPPQGREEYCHYHYGSFSRWDMIRCANAQSTIRGNRQS